MAYISSVWLESENPTPFRVFLHNDGGTREVQPNNSERFVLKLDGAQAFSWDEPFRIVVKLANGVEFHRHTRSSTHHLITARP